MSLAATEGPDFNNEFDSLGDMLKDMQPLS